MSEFISWLTNNYFLYLILVFILNVIINKLVMSLLFHQKKQKLFDLSLECKQLEYRVEKLKAELKNKDNKKE